MATIVLTTLNTKVRNDPQVCGARVVCVCVFRAWVFLRLPFLRLFSFVWFCDFAACGFCGPALDWRGVERAWRVASESLSTLLDQTTIRLAPRSGASQEAPFGSVN